MAEENVGTSVQTGEVTDDDKLWAALSWIPFVGWILAIIALLMEDKKGRPFVRYNAVLAIVVAVIVGIVGTITVGCVAVLGSVYQIYLAVKSYQGEKVEVPFISDFVRNQGWV